MLTWCTIPVPGGTTRKSSNAVGRPNTSAITEWSMTSSAGASGLIRAGSPPRSRIASRIVARSTTAGTPVKSCITTRAGVNRTSRSGSAFGSQPASARMSSVLTSAPSSVRSRFSSSTLRLNGSRSAPSTAANRKISYEVSPTARGVRAAKLSTLAMRPSSHRALRPVGQDGRVDLGLAGRVYVVSGGSRGLGRAAAEALVAEGARVVIGARHEADVERAAQELGGRGHAVGVVADLAEAASAARLVEAAHAAYGGLDGALISVGGPPQGSAMEVDEQAWRAAFESAFLGALRLARRVAGALGPDGGSIAFVLSSSVRSPIPGLAVSNALR